MKVEFLKIIHKFCAKINVHEKDEIIGNSNLTINHSIDFTIRFMWCAFERGKFSISTNLNFFWNSSLHFNYFFIFLSSDISLSVLLLSFEWAFECDKAKKFEAFRLYDNSSQKNFSFFLHFTSYRMVLFCCSLHTQLFYSLEEKLKQLKKKVKCEMVKK